MSDGVQIALILELGALVIGLLKTSIYAWVFLRIADKIDAEDLDV